MQRDSSLDEVMICKLHAMLTVVQHSKRLQCRTKSGAFVVSCSTVTGAPQISATSWRQMTCCWRHLPSTRSPSRLDAEPRKFISAKSKCERRALDG